MVSSYGTRGSLWCENKANECLNIFKRFSCVFPLNLILWKIPALLAQT